MQVHLVFVTKYRRNIFIQGAVEKLRSDFANVSADFDIEIVDMVCESYHVHLLINSPPKLAVSSVVNNIKGVSNRLDTALIFV